jgi:hypothetical protein
MPKPYPTDWDRVADLRVFRTSPEEWQKLIGWRSDMRGKGWRLLQVTSGHGNLVAVFGRTKVELHSEREEGE